MTYWFTATFFDNPKKLCKFYHFTSIIIYELDDWLNLLPIVDQPKCDKRILKFIDPDAAWSIIVERLEVFPQLF